MESRVAVIGIIIENPDSVERVNSLLHDYSPYILGRILKPLLEQVPDISPYAAEAVRYWHMLSAFDNDIFDADMLPARSVFREFIG